MSLIMSQRNQNKENILEQFGRTVEQAKAKNLRTTFKNSAKNVCYVGCSTQNENSLRLALNSDQENNNDRGSNEPNEMKTNPEDKLLISDKGVTIMKCLHLTWKSKKSKFFRNILKY